MKSTGNLSKKMKRIWTVKSKLKSVVCLFILATSETACCSTNICICQMYFCEKRSIISTQIYSLELPLFYCPITNTCWMMISSHLRGNTDGFNFKQFPMIGVWQWGSKCKFTFLCKSWTITTLKLYLQNFWCFGGTAAHLPSPAFFLEMGNWLKQEVSESKLLKESTCFFYANLQNKSISSHSAKRHLQQILLAS